MMNLKPYRHKRLTSEQYTAYFLDHVKPLGHSNLYKVTKDIQAYKKVQWHEPDNAYCGYKNHKAIASLIIPKGAILHASLMWVSELNQRKIRANKAVVHQIHDVISDKNRLEANSDWASNFKYKVGKTVRPSGCRFYMGAGICESGIHFFLQMEDALSY